MTEVWYKEGLRFGCTQCGKCCTGAPGYVWVNEQEIAEMAEFLQISKEAFVQKYVRQVGERLVLLENPKNFDCVFLEGKKCSVYGARPKQCRVFPWWPEHLKSRKAWNEAADYCEGINHKDAPLVTLKQIQEEIKKHE